MRKRTNRHTHPCTHCEAPVACDDQWERNYDGWPEVICPSFHLPNGHLAEVRCDNEHLHTVQTKVPE